MKKKLLTILIMFISSIAFFMACKDPYGNMELSVNIADEIVLYVPTEEDASQSFVSLTAKVSGVKKKLNVKTYFGLVSGSGDIVSITTGETKQGITTATITAKEAGGSYIDIITEEGGQSKRIKVSVYRRIESVDFSKSEVPIKEISSFNLNSILEFNEGTNQKDMDFHLVDKDGEWYTPTGSFATALRLENGTIYTNFADGWAITENGQAIAGTYFQTGTDGFHRIRVIGVSKYNSSITTGYLSLPIVDAVSQVSLVENKDSSIASVSDEIEMFPKTNGEFSVVLSPSSYTAGGSEYVSYTNTRMLTLYIGNGGIKNSKYSVRAVYVNANGVEITSSPFVDIKNFGYAGEHKFEIKGLTAGTQKVKFIIDYIGFEGEFTITEIVNVQTKNFPSDIYVGDTKITAVNYNDELETFYIYDKYGSGFGTAFRIDGSPADTSFKYSLALYSESGSLLTNETIKNGTTIRLGNNVTNFNQTFSNRSTIYISHNLSGDLPTVLLKVTFAFDVNPQSGTDASNYKTYTQERYVKLVYKKGADTLSLAESMELRVGQEKALLLDMPGINLSPNGGFISSITGVDEDLFTIDYSDAADGKLYVLPNDEGKFGESEITINTYNNITRKCRINVFIPFAYGSGDEVHLGLIENAALNNSVLHSKTSDGQVEFSEHGTATQDYKTLSEIYTKTNLSGQISLSFYNYYQTASGVQKVRHNNPEYVSWQTNSLYLSIERDADGLLVLNTKDRVSTLGIDIVFRIKGYNVNGEEVVFTHTVRVFIYETLTSEDLNATQSLSLYDFNSVGIYSADYYADIRLSYRKNIISYGHLKTSYTLLNANQVVATIGDVDIFVSDVLSLDTSTGKLTANMSVSNKILGLVSPASSDINQRTIEGIIKTILKDVRRFEVSVVVTQLGHEDASLGYKQSISKTVSISVDYAEKVQNVIVRGEDLNKDGLYLDSRKINSNTTKELTIDILPNSTTYFAYNAGIIARLSSNDVVRFVTGSVASNGRILNNKLSLMPVVDSNGNPRAGVVEIALYAEDSFLSDTILPQRLATVRVKVADGSASYFFELRNSSDFESIQTDINAKRSYHYVVTQDINLAASFTGFSGEFTGNLSSKFVYTIDGQVYTRNSSVNGLNIRKTAGAISDTGTNSFALFQKVSGNINNFTLAGAIVEVDTSTTYVIENLNASAYFPFANITGLKNGDIIKISDGSNAILKIDGTNYKEIIYDGRPGYQVYYLGGVQETFNVIHIKRVDNVSAGLLAVETTSSANINNFYVSGNILIKSIAQTMNVGGVVALNNGKINGADGEDSTVNIRIDIYTDQDTAAVRSVGGLVGQTTSSIGKGSSATTDGSAMTVTSEITVRTFEANENILGYASVGGIAGSAENITINNVVARPVIKAYSNVGGIVGHANKVTLNYAVTEFIDYQQTGLYSASLIAYDKLGGLIGNATEVTIRYSYVRSFLGDKVIGNNYVGNIALLRNDKALAGYKAYAGGLVGYLADTSIIQNSYFNGDISAKYSNYNELSNSYEIYIAGLVGGVSANEQLSIKDSYIYARVEYPESTEKLTVFYGSYTTLQSYDKKLADTITEEDLSINYHTVDINGTTYYADNRKLYVDEALTTLATLEYTIQGSSVFHNGSSYDIGDNQVEIGGTTYYVGRRLYSNSGLTNRVAAILGSAVSIDDGMVIVGSNQYYINEANVTIAGLDGISASESVTLSVESHLTLKFEGLVKNQNVVISNLNLKAGDKVFISEGGKFTGGDEEDEIDITTDSANLSITTDNPEEPTVTLILYIIRARDEVLTAGVDTRDIIGLYDDIAELINSTPTVTSGYTTKSITAFTADIFVDELRSALPSDVSVTSSYAKIGSEDVKYLDGLQISDTSWHVGNYMANEDLPADPSGRKWAKHDDLNGGLPVLYLEYPKYSVNGAGYTGGNLLLFILSPTNIESRIRELADSSEVKYISIENKEQNAVLFYDKETSGAGAVENNQYYIVKEGDEHFAFAEYSVGSGSALPGVKIADDVRIKTDNSTVLSVHQDSDGYYYVAALSDGIAHITIQSIASPTLVTTIKIYVTKGISDINISDLSTGSTDDVGVNEQNIFVQDSKVYQLDTKNITTGTGGKTYLSNQNVGYIVQVTSEDNLLPVYINNELVALGSYSVYPDMNRLSVESRGIGKFTVHIVPFIRTDNPAFTHFAGLDITGYGNSGYAVVESLKETIAFNAVEKAQNINTNNSTSGELLTNGRTTIKVSYDTFSYDKVGENYTNKDNLIMEVWDKNGDIVGFFNFYQFETLFSVLKFNDEISLSQLNNNLRNEQGPLFWLNNRNPNDPSYNNLMDLFVVSIDKYEQSYQESNNSLRVTYTLAISFDMQKYKDQTFTKSVKQDEYQLGNMQFDLVFTPFTNSVYGDNAMTLSSSASSNIVNSANITVERGAGSGISASYSLVINPENIEDLAVNFYPFSDTSHDEQEQKRVSPGRDGLLKLSLYPIISNADYLTITSDNDKVRLSQYVGLQSGYISTYGKSPVVDYTIPYGIALRPASFYSGTNSSGMLETVDIPYIQYDGNYYVNVFVPEGVTASAINFVIRAYRYDVNGEPEEISLPAGLGRFNLAVEPLPEIELTINGKTTIDLAMGTSDIPIVATVRNADIDSIKLTTSIVDSLGNAYTVPSSFEMITGEGGGYLLNVPQTLTRDSSGESVSASGKTLTITAKASKHVNGVEEATTVTLTVRIRQYVIDDIVLDSSAGSGNSLEVKNGTTTNIALGLLTTVGDLSGDALATYKNNKESLERLLSGVYKNEASTAGQSTQSNWFYVARSALGEEVLHSIPLDNSTIFGGRFALISNTTFVRDIAGESYSHSYAISSYNVSAGEYSIVARVRFYYDVDGVPQMWTSSYIGSYIEKNLTVNVTVKENSTYDHPNPIYNVEDLRTMQSGAHYILMNNLTLTDWEPIQTGDMASLDGNGQVITVESFDFTNTGTNAGIFATISSNAVLKNIIVDVGRMMVSNEYIKRVDQGIISDNIAIDLSGRVNVTFGVLAGINNGSITNSKIINSLYTPSNSATDPNSLFVYVSRENLSTGLPNGVVGGIVGINNGTISSSYVGTNYSTDKVTVGVEYGTMAGTSSIETYPFRIVSAKTLGSFAGENNGIITNSYSSEVSLWNWLLSATENKTGGFVAVNGGSILSSFVEGAPIGANYRADVSRGAKIESQGIIGGFVYENTRTGIIRDAYSAVRVDNNSISAGFVFYNREGGKITNAYTVTSTMGDNGKSGNNNGSFGPFVGIEENQVQAFVGDLSNTYYLVRADEGESENNYDPATAIVIDEEHLRSDQANPFLYQGTYNGFSFSSAEENDSVWTMSSDGVHGPQLVSGLRADAVSFRTSVGDGLIKRLEDAVNYMEANYNDFGFSSASPTKARMAADIILYINSINLEKYKGSVIETFSSNGVRLVGDKLEAPMRTYIASQLTAIAASETSNGYVVPASIPSNITELISEFNKRYSAEKKTSANYLIPYTTDATVNEQSIVEYYSGSSSYVLGETTAKVYNYSYRVNELGSENNPLLINTAAEFITFILNNSTQVIFRNGSGGDVEETVFGATADSLRYVRIIKNLDFSNISLNNYRVDGLILPETIFAGILEGNNLTLSGLGNLGILAPDRVTDYGLFKRVGLSDQERTGITQQGKEVGITSISNVNFSLGQAISPNAERAGVLAGSVYNSSLININFTGESTAVYVAGENLVGGVAGFIGGKTKLININVANLAVTATKSSGGDNIGDNVRAITLQDSSTRFVNYSATGFKAVNYTPDTLATAIGQMSYAGAIAGVIDTQNIDKEKDIRRITTDYDVYASDSANDDILYVFAKDRIVVSADNAGGLFGYIGEAVKVKESGFVLDATKTQTINGKRYAGGIAGENHGVLERVTVQTTQQKNNPGTMDNIYSYSVANFFGSKFTISAGGLVGFTNNGVILDSFSRVNIVGENIRIAGGLVGSAIGFNYIRHAYTTAVVNAKEVVGGAVGYVEGAENVSDMLVLDYVYALNNWTSLASKLTENMNKNYMRNQTSSYTYTTILPQVGNQNSTATNRYDVNGFEYSAPTTYIGSVIGIIASEKVINYNPTTRSYNMAFNLITTNEIRDALSFGRENGYITGRISTPSNALNTTIFSTSFGTNPSHYLTNYVTPTVANGYRANYYYFEDVFGASALTQTEDLEDILTYLNIQKTIENIKINSPQFDTIDNSASLDDIVDYLKDKHDYNGVIDYDRLPGVYDAVSGETYYFSSRIIDRNFDSTNPLGTEEASIVLDDTAGYGIKGKNGGIQTDLSLKTADVLNKLEVSGSVIFHNAGVAGREDIIVGNPQSGGFLVRRVGTKLSFLVYSTGYRSVEATMTIEAGQLYRYIASYEKNVGLKLQLAQGTGDFTTYTSLNTSWTYTNVSESKVSLFYNWKDNQTPLADATIFNTKIVVDNITRMDLDMNTYDVQSTNSTHVTYRYYEERATKISVINKVNALSPNSLSLNGATIYNGTPLPSNYEIISAIQKYEIGTSLLTEYILSNILSNLSTTDRTVFSNTVVTKYVDSIEINDLINAVNRISKVHLTVSGSSTLDKINSLLSNSYFNNRIPTIEGDTTLAKLAALEDHLNTLNTVITNRFSPKPSATDSERLDNIVSYLENNPYLWANTLGSLADSRVNGSEGISGTDASSKEATITWLISQRAVDSYFYDNISKEVAGFLNKTDTISSQNTIATLLGKTGQFGNIFGMWSFNDDFLLYGVPTDSPEDIQADSSRIWKKESDKDFPTRITGIYTNYETIKSDGDLLSVLGTSGKGGMYVLTSGEYNLHVSDKYISTVPFEGSLTGSNINLVGANDEETTSNVIAYINSSLNVLSTNASYEEIAAFLAAIGEGSFDDLITENRISLINRINKMFAVLPTNATLADILPYANALKIIEELNKTKGIDLMSVADLLAYYNAEKSQNLGNTTTSLNLKKDSNVKTIVAIVTYLRDSGVDVTDVAEENFTGTQAEIGDKITAKINEIKLKKPAINISGDNIEAKLTNIINYLEAEHKAYHKIKYIREKLGEINTNAETLITGTFGLWIASDTIDTIATYFTKHTTINVHVYAQTGSGNVAQFTSLFSSLYRAILRDIKFVFTFHSSGSADYGLGISSMALDNKASVGFLASSAEYTTFRDIEVEFNYDSDISDLALTVNGASTNTGLVFGNIKYSTVDTLTVKYDNIAISSSSANLNMGVVAGNSTNTVFNKVSVENTTHIIPVDLKGIMLNSGRNVVLGGVIGYMENGSITDVNNTSNMLLTTGLTSLTYGGIVGASKSVQITNATFVGYITTGTSVDTNYPIILGAIAGRAETSDLTNVKMNGAKIDLSLGAESTVGGLVGMLDKGRIYGISESVARDSNSVNNANITLNKKATNINFYVGGIAGRVVNGGSISIAVNLGKIDINGTSSLPSGTLYLGGIAGELEGNIDQVYSTRDIDFKATAFSAYRVGGVAGSVAGNTNSQISNFIVYGDITLDNIGKVGENCFVGGVFGKPDSDKTIVSGGIVMSRILNYNPKTAVSNNNVNSIGKYYNKNSSTTGIQNVYFVAELIPYSFDGHNMDYHKITEGGNRYGVSYVELKNYLNKDQSTTTGRLNALFTPDSSYNIPQISSLTNFLSESLAKEITDMGRKLNPKRIDNLGADGIINNTRDRTTKNYYILTSDTSRSSTRFPSNAFAGVLIGEGNITVTMTAAVPLFGVISGVVANIGVSISGTGAASVNYFANTVENNGILINCVTYGEVVGNLAVTAVNGLVGTNNGRILQSGSSIYYNGKLTGGTLSGLVGTNSGVIYDCYSTMNMNLNGDSDNTVTSAGLVYTNSGDVYNSYYAGVRNIKSSENPLVKTNSGKFTNCFYDSDAAATGVTLATVNGISGKSTAEARVAIPTPSVWTGAKFGEADGEDTSYINFGYPTINGGFAIKTIAKVVVASDTSVGKLFSYSDGSLYTANKDSSIKATVIKGISFSPEYTEHALPIFHRGMLGHIKDSKDSEGTSLYNYVLMRDVNVNSTNFNWGLGNFAHNLFGAGHKISNWNITQSGAIFDTVTGGILDLKLENISVKTAGAVSGLALVLQGYTSSTALGYMLNIALKNITLEGVNGSVGVLAGENNLGRIEGVSIESTLKISQVNDSAEVNNVGGLVGKNSGDVKGIFTADSVSIEISYVASNLGGLVGSNTGNVEIRNSSDKNINIKLSHGVNNVGGLVGVNSGSSTLSTENKLKVKAIVSATGNYVGGIVGHNTVSLSNFEIVADSTISGNAVVGGIAGYSSGMIQLTSGSAVAGAIYATGTASTSSVSGALVGGVVGYSTGIVRTGAGTAELSDENKAKVSATVYSSGGNYVGGVVGYTTGAIYNIIKDTEAVGSTTHSKDYTGGIVGYSSATISYCKNASTVLGHDYVGGISGRTSTGSIVNVVSTGDVTGNSYVGGISGYSTGEIQLKGGPAVSGIISATGTTTTSGVTGSFVGGIAGRSTGIIRTGAGATELSDANKAKVSATVYSSGGSHVGGVVGYTTGAIYNIIKDSGPVGSTTNSKDYTGGIAGYSSATISYCKNTSAVFGHDYVGGITGYGAYALTNVGNTSDVTGNFAVGGIAGRTTGITLTNTTNSGKISGSSYVGGIVGWAESAVTLAGTTNSSGNIIYTGTTPGNEDNDQGVRDSTLNAMFGVTASNKKQAQQKLGEGKDASVGNSLSLGTIIGWGSYTGNADSLSATILNESNIRILIDTYRDYYYRYDNNAGVYLWYVLEKKVYYNNVTSGSNSNSGGVEISARYYGAGYDVANGDSREMEVEITFYQVNWVTEFKVGGTSHEASGRGYIDYTWSYEGGTYSFRVYKNRNSNKKNLIGAWNTTDNFPDFYKFLNEW